MVSDTVAKISNYFYIHKKYVPTTIWMICVLLMSFASFPYSWGMYPLFITSIFWPYRYEIYNWAYEERYTILYQFLFAGIFFLYHLNDILRLELWSDEIFSLKISANPFATVAKEGLRLSDIPPLHYWDLWFWKHLVQKAPVQYSEFIFRVPSMIYHSTSAILFAWLVSRKAIHNTTRQVFFIRLSAFISIFFNPLLFPFALEVRPYSLMVLGSIISMIALDSKAYISLRYLPVMLTLFILSFFNFIYYIPVFISLWINKYRKLLCILFCLTTVMYLMYVPYVFMPMRADPSVILNAIVRSMLHIRSIFFETYMQVFMIPVVLLIILRRQNNLLFLLQVVVLWIFTYTAGYLTRYQAFSLRHLILSFPIFIYFLFVPTWQFKSKASLYWILCITIFFTVPWIIKTEYLITHQSFAPKISIGIKEAIIEGMSLHKEIALEKASLEMGDPLYFTHKYYEEISLWYIRHYTGKNPKLFIARSDCSETVNQSEYIIRFSKSECVTSDTKYSELRFKINE